MPQAYVDLANFGVAGWLKVALEAILHDFFVLYMTD